ncbi:MAG: 2-hydroxyacyl-CoA dehydratase family protein, partial [Smithellaceae bacterium]
MGEESCVGEHGTRWLTESKGSTVGEIIDSITERYFNIACAIFTPNPSREEYVKEMTEKLKA